MLNTLEEPNFTAFLNLMMESVFSRLELHWQYLDNHALLCFVSVVGGADHG